MPHTRAFNFRLLDGPPLSEVQDPDARQSIIIAYILERDNFSRSQKVYYRQRHQFDQSTYNCAKRMVGLRSYEATPIGYRLVYQDRATVPSKYDQILSPFQVAFSSRALLDRGLHIYHIQAMVYAYHQGVEGREDFDTLARLSRQYIYTGDHIRELEAYLPRRQLLAWLEKRLPARRAGMVTLNPPRDLLAPAVDRFRRHLLTLAAQKRKHRILNADQINVYVFQEDGKMIIGRGTPGDVGIEGDPRLAFTILLTVSDDGQMLSPWIIAKQDEVTARSISFDTLVAARKKFVELACQGDVGTLETFDILHFATTIEPFHSTHESSTTAPHAGSSDSAERLGIGEDDEDLDESLASANIKTRVKARLQSSVDRQLPANIATIPDELIDPYVEELVQMVQGLDEVKNEYLDKRINKVRNAVINTWNTLRKKDKRTEQVIARDNTLRLFPPFGVCSRLPRASFETLTLRSAVLYLSRNMAAASPRGDTPSLMPKLNASILRDLGVVRRAVE